MCPLKLQPIEQIFFRWGTNENALEMEGRTGGVIKNDELENITSRERIID